ncbi:MAG TPA: ATP-binding protein [Candidatus Dormibacteraeota bacterium]|nr:ATP-binding protein [Candidatus Dormibacteraeota bacterium]
MKNDFSNAAEVLKAYADYERQIYVKHLEVGCYLVMGLMPAGVILDFFVYPEKVGYFLKLRLACAILGGVIWVILHKPFSQKIHHLLSLIIALLPSFFICWMISVTEGADSPYYAGLNLVLIAIALVMRWSVDLSITASLSVMAMYLIACLLHGQISEILQGIFFNNLYFLTLTAIIMIVGGNIHRALRVREFTLRYELDKSHNALEASLKQLKENEMQLVQSEKLASLGRMSAGIIHEINNPLNFATTGLFTLRKKGKYLALEQQEDYAEILTDVEDGLKRVQSIVSDLRMFTHPNTEQLDPVPVAEVITPALRFLSNEWRDIVQIEQKFAEHQMIWANKNKLIQVMVNILQNSLDALKIKSFADGEKPTMWIEGRVENGQSILSIRDNGTGIDPKHVDKIFDPFFTTKDVGEGMGLGLSISYSIVQEYGGKISVKTEMGKFCEFTLEFPVKTNQAVN